MDFKKEVFEIDKVTKQRIIPPSIDIVEFK